MDIPGPEQGVPSDRDDLARRIRELAHSAGLDSIGFASTEVLEPARTVLHSRKARGLSASMNFTYRNPDRSTDPTRAMPTAKTLIAGAVGYGGEVVPDPVELSGRVARYSWRDHYADLRTSLEEVAGLLRSEGYSAQVHCDDNSLVDRNVAYRAGLGWYGKNSNLLLPDVGSWFVLGSVLTDADLPTNSEPVADQCGSCQRCFEGCPTDAIVGPGIIDAGKCIAWIVQAEGSIPLEFREAVGDRLYGCDDCQDVCPPNRVPTAAGEASPGAALPINRLNTEADAWVSLAWLLTASDEELMDRVGRWYIAKRDPAVVRRTALVNLGNIAEPHDQRVVAVLDVYLRHENPLLRRHAVWACRRLGRDDLLGPVLADPDDEVQEELAALVVARFGPD